MIAQRRETYVRTVDALMSAVLPGLGQLNQGRAAAAGHFLLEAILFVVIIMGVPGFGGAGVAGLLAVTAWSAVDAFRWTPDARE